MPEIRNLKGEVVKIVPEPGEGRLRLSGSTWFLIIGLILVNLGFFVKFDFLLSALRVFDIRLWPWEVFVLVPLIAAFFYQCWRIHRNWEYYDEDEERHAKNFIGFGATVLVILLFVFILLMTGRFSLFFRPVTNMFSRGIFSLAALWRSALVVVVLVPFIYFGKEWICGFWDE